MRPAVRFVAGAALGAAALALYLLLVGPGQVTERATAVPAVVVAGVLAFVVAEALVDGVGVWASVRPLGGGLSSSESVQYALAGDFFDVLSPAGPVSSEPIMAHFFAVGTGTTYSEALGVRSVAKYVKSITQLLASTLLVAALLLGGEAPRYVLLTMGGAVVVVVVAGAAVVRARGALSRVLEIALAPVVTRVSALYRDSPHDRDAVTGAIDRFWTRALYFRSAPGLLGLVALGGVLEQVLTASALWVALDGTGTAVALVPVIALVPLPQAASVVPIPGSIGAYDVLLAGALVVVTGAAPPSAAAAVLVVRTLALLTALGVGGVATGFLRGWRR